MFRALIVCGCLAVCLAAPQRLGRFQQGQGSFQQGQGSFQQQGGFLQQPTTTPVPILRQISSSNDDGSYTYGYEAGDGSFKLETRKANGEVFGKYGYIDTNGELKTVEYGASHLGFNPSGKGITVAPPTLVDETLNSDYDYDFQDAPVAAAPVRVAARAPARAAPQPVGEAEFKSRFADFDAQIAALFRTR